MRHVLLIEEDTSTARLMAWILAEAGYEIDVEPNPEAGTRHAAQDPPDVVVLNGELSPAETARWIERMHDAAPGARFVDMVKAAKRRGHPAAGAVTALFAPFDADALIHVVQEAERDGHARGAGATAPPDPSREAGAG
jgi:DNA-binding NtrC family response regulator